MGKTVTTKYDIGDKVWWKNDGKVFSGEIVNACVNIYSANTSVEYSVRLSPECVANWGEYYLDIREHKIYKAEPKIEKEVEKE